MKAKKISQQAFLTVSSAGKGALLCYTQALRPQYLLGKYPKVLLCVSPAIGKGGVLMGEQGDMSHFA